MNQQDDASRQILYGIPPTGGRLPAATRVGRVRLQVADLERSLDWYARILGLRALEREDGYAALAPHGDDSVLIELHERLGAAPVPRRGRLGLYHYAILLPDRALLGRFARHLADAGVRAGASDHAVSEALYMSDPDGLGIEVYADRPRSTWRRRDRELVIVTEPLDLDDLIRAGGGQPWAGMPAGTSIGHVHLHVGDLDRAAAFYHEALGLGKTVWSYPGALFLSAGGYHHHLGVNVWAAGAGPAGPEDARLLDWELIVPSGEDAWRALDRLESAGHPTERTDAGGTARDPWGIPVRVRAQEAN